MLPRTHFVGNSLDSFSMYINLYLFTLDLLGLSVLPKFQKSFPPMHIVSIFNRKKFCRLGSQSFVYEMTASLSDTIL